MLSRLRHFCANAALSVVSFLLTYLVCELLFFRFMLPSMSYNIRPHLPDRADFFMQNSKSHYAPHDYIALLGNSYAAGVGDWLLAGGGLADKPYHSANVIHDLTGRDVASFGRVNIGSAQAMVQRVTRILDDDYCYLFPEIETPGRFVVYFYEGNDFADNYELLLGDIKPRERRSRRASRRLPARSLRQALAVGLPRPLRRHAVAHGPLRREIRRAAAAAGDRPARHDESARARRRDPDGGGFPGAAAA